MLFPGKRRLLDPALSSMIAPGARSSAFLYARATAYTNTVAPSSTPIPLIFPVPLRLGLLAAARVATYHKPAMSMPSSGRIFGDTPTITSFFTPA